MLIDTHAHLNLEPLVNDWQKIADEAMECGVEKMVVPGANVESSKVGVEIASQREGIYAAVGIHPEEISKISTNLDLEIRELEKLIQTRKVVAIGECGLDYHYSEEVEAQKELFSLQVELAKKHDLPIIIHSRENEAIKDVAQILGSYDKCVYHCFSGESDPGTFVGIGGTISYRKNDELRKVVETIPLERIILETDAPWLPPEPFRGRINVPVGVTIVALKLAELKQVSVSRIIEQTTKNAEKLFLSKL